MDGLERFFFLASSSLIGNYEQQRSHICNVVRRFLLSFELFISAFCPQVLLSSWSTFPFLFTLFFWAEQCLWTYLWHSIIRRQTMELEVTDRDSETNIVHSLLFFLSPRLVFMNLQMDSICSQVSFESALYSAPLSLTLPTCLTIIHGTSTSDTVIPTHYANGSLISPFRLY